MRWCDLALWCHPVLPLWPWDGAEFKLDLERELIHGDSAHLWYKIQAIKNWTQVLLTAKYENNQLFTTWIRTNSDSWPESIMTSADVLRKMWYKSQKGGGAILEIWRCEEPHFELLLGYMARRHPMSPYSMSPYSKSPWSKAPTVAWVKLNSQ